MGSRESHISGTLCFESSSVVEGFESQPDRIASYSRIGWKSLACGGSVDDRVLDVRGEDFEPWFRTRGCVEYVGLRICSLGGRCREELIPRLLRVPVSAVAS